MSKYVIGKNSKKTQVWLQRMVRFWLASGMIAMPWMAQASTIVRSDGGPAITPTGNAGSQVHNIYAAKDLGNSIGANTFSQFNVTAGDIANMHFRQSAAASPTQFNTLLNFVDSRIDINGTVNAIREGGIGGHLYFLSPNGMAVGAGGVINAGALTVLTPTKNWWDKKFDGSGVLKNDALKAIQGNTVPINSSGTIAVLGKINATDKIYMGAAKIDIGQAGTAANINTTTIDFSSVVNLSPEQRQTAGITNLTAKRATNGGDIILAAEVSYNANPDAAGNAVKAELNVAGGSKIIAARNANLTATALNSSNVAVYRDSNDANANVKYLVNGESLSEKDFTTKYGDTNTNGVFKTKVSTSAIINITDDSTVQGRNVNVVAKSQNVMNNGWKNAIGEHIAQVGMALLLNGFDVCSADLTNKAEVNVGENVTLRATGLDGGTKALNVQALATNKIEIGTWAGSLNLLGSVVPNLNFFPAVNVNYASGKNEANVNIKGKLLADAGSINVGAIANNSITSTAESGLYGLGLVGNSDAVLSCGINGVVGYNKSNLIIGDKAVIDAVADVELDSHATSSIIAKTSVVTTEKSTMAFGVGWLDYDNIAKLEVGGKVTSKTGKITLDAAATYPDNTFYVSTDAGQTIIARAMGRAVNYLGNKTGIKQGTLDGLSKSLAKVGIPGVKNTGNPDGDAVKSASEKLADLFKLGITFAYMDEENTSDVFIKSTGSVESMDKGNITVNSKAHLDDLLTYGVGTTNNNEDYKAGESSTPAVLVNGAIFLRKLTNQGNLTIDTRSDAKTAAIKGGKVTLAAEATAPYNRIGYMRKVKTKTEKEVANSCPQWSNPTDGDVKVLKKYYEAAMAEKNRIEAGMYDEKGELKPEYADKETGSAKMQEKMNEYRNTQQYKDYYKLITEGKYTENGKEKTIGSAPARNVIDILTKTVAQMAKPQNYFNYSVSAEIDSRGSKEGGESKFGIGIAFGMDTVNNDTRILLGDNTFVDASMGIDIGTTAYFSDINCNGGWAYNEAGKSGANMDLVVLQHLNVNSIVAATEGSKLYAGAEDLKVTAKDTVKRVNVGKPLLLSEGAAVVLDVNYFTTESNTLISLDDEMELKSDKTISLNGTNTTGMILFTGGLASGSKAGAVGVGISKINRNNIVAVADNDGVGTLVQTNKSSGKTDATDLSEKDNEETRMKKLLAVKSGLNDNKVISFYSNNFTKSGSIQALTLDSQVLTKGKLGDFVVDIALASTDESGGEGKIATALNWLGSKVKGVYNAIFDKTNKDPQMVEMQNLGKDGKEVGNQSKQKHVDNDGHEHNDGVNNNGATLSLSGAGSVGLTQLDAVTASVIKNIAITLKEGKNKISNSARDDSLLVAAAGGAAASTVTKVNGGSGSSWVLSGAISISDVNSKLFATIGGCQISGTNVIDNLATREGALANAAAAVSYTSTSENVKNASFAIGAAVNLANYVTEAKMQGNSVNATGTAKTDIVNMAVDKDIQITGGVDINIVKGGSKAFGLGGIASWGYLNNRVYSVLENGTYRSLGKLGVTAVTDLTQINAAVGIGVSGSTGNSKAFQGALVYAKLVNDVKANIKSANITGDTLQVAAYDTNNLTKDNAYANALKQDYGFDVDGKTYTSHAQTQTTDKDKKTKLEDSGNLIVSAAVEVTAATGGSSGAAAGASAVIGIIDNDFNSTVEGSTITLSGDIVKTAEGNDVYPAKVWAESNTLEVGVAAGGNGSQSGFAGGGSVVVNLFKNDVNAKVEGSTYNVSGLQVDAKNKQKLVNVAGQIDIGKNAVGLDMVYNYMLNNTGAYFTNSSIEKKTTKGLDESNLVLDAANNSDIYAIALGVSASVKADASAAANGSIAVNRGQNNVEAVAMKNVGGKLHLAGLKTFTVHSKDDSYFAAATGGLTISLGKTALGGALTWNRLGSLTVSPTGTIGKDDNKKQVNKAIVSGYDIHMADNGVLTVNAEDKAKFNTVAVGVGIGTTGTKFTLQGANANTYINKETTASIIGGNINQDSATYQDDKHFANVNITADTNNKFNSVSAVFATSGKAAIGAALTQDTMKVDTRAAAAASGATGSGYSVDNLAVKAVSDNTIKNIALGLAVSGKIAIGGSVTDSLISNNTEAELGGAEAGVTTVKSRGNIGVVSQSKEALNNIAGDANVSLGGMFSGGASVALNEIKGNTLATVRNASIETESSDKNKISLRDSIDGKPLELTGLVVGADAFHELKNAPYCATFSAKLDEGVAVAADATVGIDTISGTTGARIISTDVNKKDTSSKLGKNVSVRSTDKTDVFTMVNNAAVSLAKSGGGTGFAASVGAGVNSDKNTRTVEATVTGDEKRKTINADQLDVTAKSLEELKAVNTAVSVAVGVGGVGVAVNAGLTYAGLDVTTSAGLRNVTGTNNGLNILADHKDNITLVGTGVVVAVSVSEKYLPAVAVGLGLAKESNVSKTTAYLDNSQIYHYADNQATDTIKAVNDSTVNTQALGIAASAAILSFSVGVLLANNDLHETATVSVNKSVIGTDWSRAKNITLGSESKITGTFKNQNIDGGLMTGIGVGVGKNYVRSGVVTDVIDSQLYSSGNIDIKNTENINLTASMLAVDLGALSVGVSSLFNYFGSEEGEENYSDWDRKHSSDRKNNNYVKVIEFRDSKSNFTIKKINDSSKETMDNAQKTATAAGNAAKAAANFEVKLVPVTSDFKGNKINVLQSDLQAKGNISAKTEEQITTNDKLGGGSLGVVSVQVEKNIQEFAGKVGVNITGGTWSAGNNITVDSFLSGSLKNDTVQVGGGAVQVGVTVAKVTKKQESGSTIAANGVKLQAGNNISLDSKDTLELKNEVFSYDLGLVTAAAVDLVATDKAVTSITGSRNDFEAGSISLTSTAIPHVVSNAASGSVGIVAGSGFVLEGRADNMAKISLTDTNRFWSDDVKIISSVSSNNDGNFNNVYTDIFGVGAGGLNIAVNKAEAYTAVEAATDVGVLTLKTKEVTDSNGKKQKIGTGKVVIGAENSTKLKTRSNSYNYGIINSGTNYSITKNENKAKTTVKAGTGDQALYANELNVYALNHDTVDAYANGNGGGIVDVSPRAAAIDAHVTGTTTTTLSGKFNITSTLNGSAKKIDDLKYFADVIQGRALGGAGVGWDVVGKETTTLDLDAANITASTVNMSSLTSVNLNKVEDQEVKDTYSKGSKKPTMAIDTRVYSLLDGDKNYLNNNWTITDKIDVKAGSMQVAGPINLTAYTDGNMGLYNYIEVWGIILGVGLAHSTSNVTVNDEIKLSNGADLRTTAADNSIDLAASDNLRTLVHSEARVGAGVVGAVNPEVTNTLTRNNTVDVENGKIFSLQDVKLYAGKREDGTISKTDTSLSAISYTCDSLIPIAKAKLSNNINANNVVKVQKQGDVRATRNVDLYADAGNEILLTLCKGYGNGKKSAEVGSKEGSKTSTNSKNCYVLVDGLVNAGVANKLSITIGSETVRNVFVADEDVQVAKESGITFYSPKEKDKFISLGTSAEELKAAELGEITLDKFTFETLPYSDVLTNRLRTVVALYEEYKNSKNVNSAMMTGLSSEIDHLKSLREATKTSPDTRYDCIVLPNLVASGGNVNVSTVNFKGSGQVVANGSPSITVKNYTNLTMKLNRVQVEEPGGVISYNGKDLDQSKLQQQVKELNQDHNLTVATMKAAKGISGDITIKGMYNGNPISYTKDNENISYIPRADIVINGFVNSRRGNVTVISDNNDIVIESKIKEGASGKILEEASVSGQVITLKALKGSISQGYTDGIVSIGGNVKDQYSTWYQGLVKANYSDNSNKSATTDLIRIEPKDGEKVDSSSTSGKWIVGNQIYLNALEINVNGVMQSGFGEYYVNIGDSAVAKIKSIEANYNSKQINVTDDSVLGSASYRVVEGGAYWSSADGCYRYQLNVYYNPVTKRLLTENINNVGGGKISLIGRIASTGNGKLICLDGSYNIAVNNTTDYDLQLGTLLVNDAKGEISIKDTGYNNQETKYTRDSSNLTYDPVSNLRYNWVTGHRSSFVSVRSVTNSEKRIFWIDYGHKRSEEETRALLEKSTEIEKPKQVSNQKMTDGVYVSKVANAPAVSYTHQHDRVQDKLVYRETKTTTKGWLLWRKKTATDYYTRTTGDEYYDYASVKADNPIAIKFIGTTADQAHVNVTSKNDVYLNGNLGNMRLYESNGIHNEKGTVNLNSSKGSIIRENGAIYGNTVKLAANDNLDNIQISAGNTVNLEGVFNETGTITVGATYGGGVGNVLLYNLGSVNAAELSLTAAGDIIQNSSSNLVVADKITLISGGSVSGKGTELLHLQGGQTFDLDRSDDIDSASVNITAQDNIRIQQAKGDLRVGKIYSNAGDIYISVPDGGILDALPYEDTSTNASAEKLISMWQRMGLVKTTDAEGNNTEVWQSMQDQQKLAKNGANAYAKEVTKNYERYQVLSVKEKLNESEKLELADLKEKFNGYASADAYLNNDSDYQKLKTICDNMSDTYQGWDQNALLYAIDERIISPDTHKDIPGKEANLYGRNITLSVLDGVGLNATEKRYVTYDELNPKKNENYVDALKKIATADVGTVKRDDDNKRYVITPLSSVGVQHTKNGSVSVIASGEQGEQEGDVYLEGRKVAEKIAAIHNQCNDFYLKRIYTAGGNIRLANSGNILTSEGAESSVIITGDNLYLQAGQGDLGSRTNPLSLNVDGALTALATGNIYLVEQGGSDLYISKVLAGEKDGNYDAGMGNIFITAKGNILMRANSDLDHYFIHSYTDGGITLVSETGSIGSKDGAISIVNSTEEQARKNHGQVSLTAKNGIYVEGISSKTGPNDFKEGVVPAGILNVIKAATGTHELQFTVNGGLKLPEVNFLDGSSKLDGSLTLKAANLILTGQTAAAKVDILGAYGIKQESGVLRGDSISLTTGKTFTIQSGKVIWNNVKLKKADVTQVNGQGKNSHLETKDLLVSASGNIDLNSTDNQLETVVLDGADDVFLAGTALTEQPLQSNQHKVITLKVTNTYDNNQHTYEFAEKSEIKNNVVGGRVEVYIYEPTNGPVTDLKIDGDLLAAGDVVLYNGGSGTVNLSGKVGQNLYADGTVLVYGGGKVISDVNYKSTGGIALVSEDNLDVNAQTISSDASLYLHSFKGNIIDTNTDKTLVSKIGGDLTLLADKGDVVLNRSYEVKGDITIRAEDSIENECAKGLHSLNGDITIYTTGNNSAGKVEGWLINEAPLKADNGDVYIYAYNGVGNGVTIEGEMVTIFSNGVVINGDTDANKDYIHATKGVNIMARGCLENTEALWADNGNVLLGGIYDDATAGSTWSEFNGEVKNSGTIYVETNGDVNVVATGNLTNLGRIYTSAGSVNIVSEKAVNNTAGLIYTGTGDVTLAAEQNLTNKSTLYAVNGEVYLESANGNIDNYVDFRESATTGASKRVTMIATNGSITNNSNIFAQEDIMIESSKGFYNYGNGNSEICSTNGDITITVWNTGNDGDIELKGTNVSAGKSLGISGTGTFKGTGNMEAKKGDLQLDAELVENMGTMTASGDVRIESGDGAVQLTGAVHAGNSIFVDSEGNITGIGSWTADKEDIIAMGKDIFLGGDSASVTAAKKVILWAQGSLTNSDSVQAGESVDMLALDGKLTNNGTIASTGDVGLYGSKGILNTKDITSNKGGIDFSSDGKVENHGALTALGAKVELSGLGIENTKDVVAVEDVTMASGGTLNNTGSIGTFGTLTLEAKGNLDNTGDLFADGNICLLSSEGNISNSGIFDAKGTDEVTMAGGAVIIKAEKGIIVNTKAIEADGDVIIKSRGSINYVDQAGFRVRSYTGDIEITSTGTGENEGFIYNKAGIKADEGSVKLVAQNDIYNESQLVAGIGLELNSAGTVYNRNTIDAGTGITIIGDLGVENGNINANDVTGIYAKTVRGDIEITSSAGTVKNDAMLWTQNGSVYIEANGAEDSGYFANGLSVLNGDNGDIIANGGNVVIKGAKGVEDSGDILATSGGRNYAGNIEIYSTDGGIALWSNETGEQKGGNIFKAEGNLILYAPKEGLYSVKDFDAVDDIKFILGGSKKDPTTGEYLISVNNSIHSSKGNIIVMTEEKGTPLALVAGVGITADEGSVILHSEGDALVYGDIIAGLDINIGAVETAEVKGNLLATNGSIVLGTEKGDMNVMGEFSGERVVLYTEGLDANISVDMDNLTVTEELILAGNKWNNGGILDISMIDTDEDGFALRLFSAGRQESGANYNLGFGTDGRSVSIQDIAVDKITIHASGPVKIDRLQVTDKAEIYTMGTKTSVYGTMQEYDADAKVIYYAPVTDGRYIDLHNMLFDGGRNTEQYQNEMDTLWALGSEAFVYGDVDNSNSMYLDIRTAIEQTGDGLLLRNYYGQKTDERRHSLEQLMQHLLNLKAIDSYNEEFNKNIEFFQRFNLMEIPDVTVNRPIDLKDGSFEIEGTCTDEEGKKVVKKVKYEF